MTAGAGHPPWLSGMPGDWRLSLWVQPGAARTGTSGAHDGRLCLRVAAPPIDGRANEAVRSFIAERLGLPRACVSIDQGESGRRKRVRVACECTAARMVERLGGVPPGAHQGDAP